jgi:phage FluMu protein Com
MTKVLCPGCDKWLARREDQRVIFFCPRCKTETAVEIVELLRELACWLAEMEIQYASVIRAQAEVAVMPMAGRTLVGGGRRKGSGGAD